MKINSFVVGAVIFAATACAANAQPKALPQINVCTGPQGGNYEFVGQKLYEQLKGLVVVNVINTNGSMTNLEALDSGRCDTAIVQSDAMNVYMSQHSGSALRIERGRELYPEYVHLVCNSEKGYSKITRLKQGDKILVGANGGGASVTFESFRLADPGRYGPIATSPIGDKRGANMVQGGSADCMLYVAGLNSGLMSYIDQLAADKPGSLTLVPTDDSDLPKFTGSSKSPVYQATKIPGGTYPKGLQTGLFTSVGAISVQSVFVTNIDYIDKHSDAGDNTYNVVLDGLSKAMPAVLNRVNGR